MRKLVLSKLNLDVAWTKKAFDDEGNITGKEGLIDLSDAVVCISEFIKRDISRDCNVEKKPLYFIHSRNHTT